MTHDFSHAAMHRLAGWPVLARIGARNTEANRLDSRAVAYLYARATKTDWADMSADEHAFAKAPRLRDNTPNLDVYVPQTKTSP